jgi:hypothetical protein
LEGIESLFLAQKLEEFEEDTDLYLLAWGPEEFELIQSSLVSKLLICRSLKQLGLLRVFFSSRDLPT